MHLASLVCMVLRWCMCFLLRWSDSQQKFGRTFGPARLSSKLQCSPYLFFPSATSDAQFVSRKSTLLRQLIKWTVFVHGSLRTCQCSGSRNAEFQQRPAFPSWPQSSCLSWRTQLVSEKDADEGGAEKDDHDTLPILSQ